MLPRPTRKISTSPIEQTIEAENLLKEVAISLNYIGSVDYKMEDVIKKLNYADTNYITKEEYSDALFDMAVYLQQNLTDSMGNEYKKLSTMLESEYSKISTQNASMIEQINLLKEGVQMQSKNNPLRLATTISAIGTFTSIIVASLLYTFNSVAAFAFLYPSFIGIGLTMFLLHEYTKNNHV